MKKLRETITKMKNFNYKKIINEIIKIVLLILSLYILPSLIYSIIGFSDAVNDDLLKLLSTLIYLLVLIFIFRKSLKKEFKIFKDSYKENLKIGFKCWGLGLLFMIMSNYIINVYIFQNTIAANEELNRQALLEFPLYSSISAVLIAPFIEELIFRKSIKPLFKNVIAYTLISGILFGLAHALTEIESYKQLLYVIPYGSLGYYFAVAYHKTKTLFTPIFIHAFHNGIMLLLLFSLSEVLI